MKKIDVTKLIKVSTYAKRAEVSVQYVYEIIKHGKLDLIEIDGMKFVKLKDD